MAKIFVKCSFCGVLTATGYGETLDLLTTRVFCHDCGAPITLPMYMWDDILKDADLNDVDLGYIRICHTPVNCDVCSVRFTCYTEKFAVGT